MTRQAWIVATASSLLSLVFYLGVEWEKICRTKPMTTVKSQVALSPVPSVPSPPKLPQVPPLQEVEAKKNYQKWSVKGQEAEKNGNLTQAMQYYSLALNYLPNTELEKHIEKLRRQVYNIKENNLGDDVVWGSANELEEHGRYTQALQLYQKLSAQCPHSRQLQTKIDFCRLVLKMEQEQQELVTHVQELMLRGEYDDAVRQLQRIIELYEKWPDSKIKSVKILAGLKDTITKLAVLQKWWPEIKELLRQKRPAYVLIRVQKLPSDFPKQGLLHKLKQTLEREMAWIPQGEFIMGSDEQMDESPRRVVPVAGYYIDRYEVTNGEYLNFVEHTGYFKPVIWTNGKIPDGKINHPVTGISWKDAKEYATWVGKRLPTEVEWEKAARGSDGRIYPWGNEFSPNVCNSLESALNGTTEVGSFPGGKSLYECFDMAGNVLEWTADVYAPYPNGREPLYIRPNYRVARGGSWYYPGQVLYCSNRYPHTEDVCLVSIGFRCAFDNYEENSKNQ